MAEGITNSDFAGVDMDEARRSLPSLDQLAAGGGDEDEGLEDGGATYEPGERLEGDEWDSMTPAQRRVFRERETAKRELAQRLEATEARLRAMEASQQAAAQNGRQPPPDPNDLSHFDEDTLYGWIDSYHRAHARAEAEPDNDAVQAEAAKMSPAYYARVQRHLMNKAADSRVAALEAKLDARGAEANLENSLSRALLNTHGVDGMLAIQQQQGPVYARTQEILAEAAAAVPFITQNKQAASTATYFASLLAKRELSRGEGSDRSVMDRRRLGLEAQTRRAPGLRAQGPTGRKAGLQSRNDQISQLNEFLSNS